MRKTVCLHKKFTTFFCLLIFLFTISNFSWGQQVIGSFPIMDGGFESQTGTLGSASSISSVQSAWTTQVSTSGIISNSGGR